MMKRVLLKILHLFGFAKDVIGYTRDGKKIVCASSKKVEELEPYVARVLEALGHPEAWITDLSTVMDFRYKLKDVEPYESHGHTITKQIVALDPDDMRLQEVASRLGLDYIEPDEYIWQIAQRLKLRG